MLLFVQKEGIVEMHASDCNTCDTWSQGTVSEPETDIEEIITKAAGCSLVKWQSMAPEEGDAKLKKACKSRAKAKRQAQNKKRRMQEQEERVPGAGLPVPELPVPELPVPELPSNYTWKVPNKQNLLDTQAAWIVHENQERRKEILDRASAKMAEAMSKAGAMMQEAIEILKEI
jgi:hypothetical protein